MKTIFFGPNPSIVRWSYTDVIQNKDCEYCDFHEKNNTKAKKFLFLRRFQEILPHSFKRLLYRRLLGYDFLKRKTDDELLFVFTCQYSMFFMTCFWTFISFLKREFPKAYFAFYYYDLIATCCPELVPKVKEEFPMVLTFDPGDAKKYDLIYYGEICAYNKPEGDDTIAPFDVFYAGGDRGRFKTVLAAFIKMADAGKKCIFYVIDIDSKHTKMIQETFQSEYVDLEQGCTFGYKGSQFNCNIYCPYPKALNHIEKCKCLFEVVFPGQTSGSLRLPQACIYGKKLITNCAFVSERSFYQEENIQIFQDIEQIDTEWIDGGLVPVQYDFSALGMFEWIIENKE